jgi:hypothetical protein
VPVLHTSDESPCAGWALPVHEKPIEDPTQPVTLASAVHPVATEVVSIQQYSVAPLLAVPTLQLRAESLSPGLSVPVHEYPLAPLTHPTMLESCEQVAGTTPEPGGVPESEPPFTVAVQPDIAVMIRTNDARRRESFDAMVSIRARAVPAWQR